MEDYAGTISLSQSQGLDLCHTSEEEEDGHSPRSVPPLSGIACGTGPSSSRRPKMIMGSPAAEVLLTTRKPRGRPPGSKNKPKPAIVVTRESDLAAMKPAVLEISPGSDVVETLAHFARKRHLGVTILSGTGTVSDVTLRHPGSHAPNLTLHGPFTILSLTGTFLLTSSSWSCSFGISLAGAQGQVFGGIVAGKVVAASQVVLVAATFITPSFHKLPGGDLEEADQETKPSGGGVSEGCSSTSMSMSVYGDAAPTPLNSCHISPDVLSWGPTSRPHPPY